MKGEIDEHQLRSSKYLGVPFEKVIEQPKKISTQKLENIIRKRVSRILGTVVETE